MNTSIHQALADHRRSWDSRQAALLALPLSLLLVITVADIVTAPQQIHLGPLIVVAPAITASFAGPRLTALMGVLAVIAQVIMSAVQDDLGATTGWARLLALAVVSAVVVVFCCARERGKQELNRVRSVAEAAQQVILPPLPRRVGLLRTASLYLAAENEAQIGGDLYAIARTPKGSTRVIIGDVRGKGLPAISDASVLLGAFREAAPRQDELTDLAAWLEESVHRYLHGLDQPGLMAEEHFITALLLDIPDDGPVAEMISCGHPPPVLRYDRNVTVLDSEQPMPPLGLGDLPGLRHSVDKFTFDVGDMLLLYTDGVIEARDAAGHFYPLIEQVASVPASNAEGLLGCISRDLMAHVGGHLGDDAAMIAIERLPW